MSTSSFNEKSLILNKLKNSIIKYLVAFLFILHAIIGFAQYDALLGRSIKEIQKGVNPIFDTMSHEQRIAKAKEIRDFAIQHKDDMLEMNMEMDLFQIFRKTNPNKVEFEKEVKRLTGFAQAKKLPEAEATIIRHHAFYIMNSDQNYELAFDKFKEHFEFIKKIDIRDYPYIIDEMASLVFLYYDFEDYQQTLYYADEAIKVGKVRNVKSLQLTMNLVKGYAFRGLNLLDSSDYYLNNAYQLATKWNDINVQGISKCYLGINSYKRNEIENSTKYFEEGCEILERQNEFKEVFLLCRSYLADIYVHQKNELLVKKQVDLIEKNNKIIVYEKDGPNFYSFLANAYTFLGQREKALTAYGQAKKAQELVAQKYDAKKFQREKQQVEILKLRKAQEVKIFQRNSLIGILLLLFITSIAIYFFNSIRSKKRLKELQKEMQEAQFYFDRFKEEIKVKAEIFEKTEMQSDALSKLEELTIITDEQWEIFRKQFDKIHQGFIRKIKIEIPDLSPAELRYMVLLKLDFSNKEMGRILGISDSSVRSISSRLRKKISPNSDVNLSELINNV
ncbi:hypothetical protein EGI22_04400 [Lacihabitans sp. LS3-19]|uniref:helix-turn-helix transcriptional regulator n=1 Tax=Lacihabitans sp. LS3-19 TaxID=2487335 RepID=UPI0020CDF0FB|nr:hypothetical protein [Lacihabitans sp. LS3-19]MCP9767139.1 hypothetical protein [Lacihabitans sp. LS3-19]